jgi:hypothetical protein
MIAGWESDFKSMAFDLNVTRLFKSIYSNSIPATQPVLKSARTLLKPMRFHEGFSGFPVLSIGVTALKFVFKPKTLLNAGGNFNRVKLVQWRHVPSACAPVSFGVAESAAVSACLHKSLAGWLALHVFVNSLQIKSEMTWMLSAEPWGNDPVVHEREQTYHSIGMGPEPWSTATKAVSFLLSRPDANLICGVEQLPKLGAEALELVRAVPLLGGVGPEALFAPMG